MSDEKQYTFWVGNTDAMRELLHLMIDLSDPGKTNDDLAAAWDAREHLMGADAFATALMQCVTSLCSMALANGCPEDRLPVYLLASMQAALDFRDEPVVPVAKA